MRTFTQQQLVEILAKHKLWLEGNGGERANLSYSDLRYSDLSYSDLSYSDLSYSNLRGSNLSYSDLSYSNLRGSDLSYSKGIIAITTGQWAIYVNQDTTQIGCQNHANDQWQSFTDEQINEMHGNALAFWQTWKPAWEIAVSEVRRLWPREAKQEAVTVEGSERR